MAYNIESLLTILDEILHPHKTTWITNNRKELESLFQKVSSLKHLLGTSSQLKGPQIETLESEITDASREAEDIIEPNMVDQMLSKPYDTTFKIFPTNLSRVMEKFDAVVEKLTKMVKDQAGRDTISAATSIPLGVSDSKTSTKQDIVVGFDGDMLQLKDRLTRQTSKLQILPIVGMGGIGKTTLARNLYDDPFIRSHFHALAWVTVLQDYSVRTILLDLLRCIIGKLSEAMLQAKNEKLALVVYQSLYGQRYLVVVDDIWGTEAWDAIKLFFPNNNLRSRILLTCRNLNVAKYADPSSEHHQMHLLNNAQSWELFQHKVFGNKSFPASLEGTGRKIATNCGGLPLAINVVGGLLSENINSKDLWDQVAKDVSSVVAERDEHFSKILTLSYNNLPYHLRPCFLYMAAFPEDYEARASRLKRLWVAEGFVKPSESKDLEEAAEEYLQALANRNLLSVRQYRSNREAKTYSMHDILRELCVRKAREEEFLWVKNKRVEKFKEGSFYSLRRVSVHTSYRIRDVSASAEYMSLARSFICPGLASHVILSPVFFALKLLRVLDVFQVKFPRFPEQVLQLVNLRFLALSTGSDLHPEISRLRYLQTLIAELLSHYSSFTIPSDIWDIPELRHLELKNNTIFMEQNCYPVTLEKLQTLRYVVLNDLVASLLTKIPNIKELGIRIFLSWQIRDANFSHLHNLETLRLLGYPYSRAPDHVPEIEFPPSIRKLTLANLTIPQSFVSTISLLPNLQVLKMRNCSFNEGHAEWELDEGEFESLQYLMLYQVKNLARWKADDARFPKLRELVIRECYGLEGIPSSFGDIASLEKIDLDDSNPSLVASARQIEDEQREYGNERLQILIHQ